MIPPRPAWRRWLNLAVAVLVVIAAVVEIRLYVVPASDSAGPADAVVVLGGQEYKARLATADVMLAKFPGSVVVVSIPGNITCPPQPPGASAILCFSPNPSTTQGEAQMASKLAAKYGWKTMEVVTTADQVWRARLRFSRCWAGNLTVVRSNSSIYSRMRAVPYETAATIKAETLQRGC
ncbi:MAG TPA: hypothetical protein VGL75_10115 [Acidothermaceae bacterium]